jgi:large subunit ribosomal protein L21
MYAVIRTGGKQYTVRPGDKLRVERLTNELGSEFDLNEVLLVGGEKVLVGNPIIAGAKVTVVVTQQAKAPRLIVFKKKRRQGYRRTKGHRQLYTELFVKAIHAGGKVLEAEQKAIVVDPVKIAERKLKYANEAKDKKASAPKAAKKTTPAKKAAPKKKAAAKKKKAVAKKKPAAKKKSASTKK